MAPEVFLAITGCMCGYLSLWCFALGKEFLTQIQILIQNFNKAIFNVAFQIILNVSFEI